MQGRQRHGFIGCGRVGRTLAQAFANAGYKVTGAWSRKAADLALMAGKYLACSRLRARRRWPMAATLSG